VTSPSETAPSVYLYADPVAHTLSPRMHAAAFRAAGRAGRYEARHVRAHELAAALDDLRRPHVLGANLSLPHKEAALPLLDELSDAARAVGAVNTVVSHGGRLRGDNTDAPGLLGALRDADAGLGPNDAAVVLGAGGAARAAVWALLHGTEARTVYVVNRSVARAERLTETLGGTALAASDVPWTDVALVVNATSAGLDAPDLSPLPDLRPLAAGTFVYDMVYRPDPTRLVRDARARGLRAESGLGMLAHQASLAFEAWTHLRVPARVFLDAARAGDA
jgi:shikimate dehydrogenase